MAVAQESDFLRRKIKGTVPIVDEDEIVPGAVHFREPKHNRSLTYAPSPRKPSVQAISETGTGTKQLRGIHFAHQPSGSRSRATGAARPGNARDSEPNARPHILSTARVSFGRNFIAWRDSRRELGFVSEEVKRTIPFDQGPANHDAAKTVLAALRRFRRPAPTKEHCELCGVGLASNHRHLLETSNARIICACDPCAFRFQDVTGGRFKLIPGEVQFLPQFQLSDGEWDSLALPINLAFFFYNTPQEKVKAMYPSPAGATESLLPLPAWETIVSNNVRLAELKPDVEALLVNRVGTKRDYYLAPIDVCFELVGLIRVHWRGLSGGDLAWEEIEKFFARLQGMAR
jgi:hypothetical protein